MTALSRRGLRRHLLRLRSHHRRRATWLARQHHPKPSAGHPCPTCRRDRWRTVEKGVAWQCRTCGLVREAATPETS